MSFSHCGVPNLDYSNTPKNYKEDSYSMKFLIGYEKSGGYVMEAFNVLQLSMAFGVERWLRLTMKTAVLFCPTRSIHDHDSFCRFSLVHLNVFLNTL
jgi:hypothetical protein